MRIGLFITCFVDSMRPEIGSSTLKSARAEKESKIGRSIYISL
jgi:hypothetical protein